VQVSLHPWRTKSKLNYICGGVVLPVLPELLPVLPELLPVFPEVLPVFPEVLPVVPVWPELELELELLFLCFLCFFPEVWL
jgi:hypothetical protein